MSNVQPEDVEPKLRRKRYEKGLPRLRAELCHLQAWVKHKGLRIMVVFEGRAAPALLSVWVSLLLCSPSPAAAALPTADEFMQELHISVGDKQRILDGKIVDWSPSEGSDRELALGMAFLAKAKPEDLAQIYRAAIITKEIPVLTALGQITGEGTMAEFVGVKLEPYGEKEARRYLEVEPGDKLNLDAKEMAAFQALKSAGKKGELPVMAVETLIRQGLLARYQAYRTKGLAGIAPYERGHGNQRRAGDELVLFTKELTRTAKYLPAFHNFLMNYPNGMTTEEAKNLEEFFYWLNNDVFGRPTYVLVHRMLYHEGEAVLAVERQFYASHDYNSMLQAIAGLPTKEGTFCFYIGRVSTDQVAGVTSPALHPLSRVIAAPYIKDMFERLQAKAKKQ